jgi:flagellar motor component MotA
MRIVGLALLTLGMLMGIGSNLHAFVDPPSIIIVVTFTVGALWLSGASLPAMVRAVTSPGLPADERAEAVSAWKLATHAAVASGIIGVMVGAVIMLRNIDDIGAIGPGLAICILTVFYGTAVGYGVCAPCRRYIESRLTA